MAEVRDRVLAAVRAGDITRTRRGRKWWISDTDSRPLTAAERRHLDRLIKDNVVRFWTAGGYPSGWPIGGYEIHPNAPKGADRG